MSIPAKIMTDLEALQTQINSAHPLESAPYATIQAINLNAENLETSTTLALYEAAGELDTWQAPRDQIGIIAGVQAAVSSARDEWRLLDMLTAISRSVLNLDLLVGAVDAPIERKTIVPV